MDNACFLSSDLDYLNNLLKLFAVFNIISIQIVYITRVSITKPSQAVFMNELAVLLCTGNERSICVMCFYLAIWILSIIC